jgi:hypothetical protein
MKFKLLDTAVLKHGLPHHGLRRGDVGAVVEVYSPNALEVEFVRGSGETQALVTLRPADLRRMRGDDLLAVRSIRRARTRAPATAKRVRR